MRPSQRLLTNYGWVLLALSTCVRCASADPNLVRNGDFETGDLTGWVNGRDVSFAPGSGSRFAGSLEQGATSKQGPGQMVALPPGTTKLAVSWRAKVEGLVVGAKPWNTARLVWEYQNVAGVHVGAWSSLDLATNTDWKAQSKTVDVPAEAVKLALYVSIDGGAQGHLWFDDINVQAVGGTPPAAESRTDTAGWYALEAAPPDYSKPPVTDLRFLLDAPAGKHGFARSEGGHFVFTDGVRVKFWGVNYGGGDFFKASKTSVDALLDRLAQSGCNMVRLHQLDASYRDVHLFGTGVRPSSTRQIAAERLGQVDYFIAGAKKRGIYIYLDLLTGRVFGKEDGVVDAEKLGVNAAIVANFDPKIIQLQQEFAGQLLGHRNAYTGLRYADDPAIALTEIVNESTLFDKWHWSGVPAHYRDELMTLWGAWCTAHEVPRPEGDIAALFESHNASFGQFLAELQTSYFKDMAAYLHGLGARYPLAGTNWQSFEADLISNASMDFIDRHVYWDHPTGGWDVTNTVTNLAEVRRPAAWQSPGSLARDRIAGKPYVLSEWNNCRPNEYLTEGPLLMAATAAFQDWDGLLQFSYRDAGWNPRMRGIWDLGEQPHNWAPRLASALIFLRGDIEPAPSSYTAKIGAPENGTRFIENNFPAGLAYLTRIAASPTAAPEPVPPCPPDSDANALYRNANGMSWQGGTGVFTVDTPRTQAVLGFVGGGTFPLRAVAMSPQTPFCQLILSSLDGLPLATSKHMLLTATARAENSGTVYNGARTSLKNEGAAPILIEPVKASLRFSGAPVAVTPLDHNGYRRTASLKAQPDGSISIGEEKSFWYEVTRD